MFSSLSHSSEENVWKLCEQVKKQNPNELSKCYAVFVSNERRTVPLWRQKAGRGEDKLVVWVSHKKAFSIKAARFSLPCNCVRESIFNQIHSDYPFSVINLYSNGNSRRLKLQSSSHLFFCSE